MKLDVGCGPVRLEGFTPIDMTLGHDVRCIPVVPDTCDEIRASHVLEHLGHGESLLAIRHWVDLLQEEGWLKISVPDFDWIVKQYCDGGGGDHQLEWYLMGGQVSPDDFHRAIFNETKLSTMLSLAGLEHIQRWPGSFDTSMHPCSLNLMGQKPKRSAATPNEPRRDVAIAMTLPRLGFSENSTNLMLAIADLGMPAIRSSGAFWEAGITRAFEQALKIPDVKWILAVDYDTVFSASDVLTLLEQAERLGLDALSPLQVGRERDTVLLTINDDNGNPLIKVPAPEPNEEVLRVSTMHFGLTLIRVEKLRQLPQPWFIGHTAPDKSWGEGRMDADIHFWRAWEKAGFKAHTSWKVRVGHLQLLVSWPDHSLATRHQYLSQWTTSGKPHYARRLYNLTNTAPASPAETPAPELPPAP